MSTVRLSQILQNSVVEQIRAMIDAFDTIALGNQPRPPVPSSNPGALALGAGNGWDPITIAPSVQAIQTDGSFLVTLAGPVQWVGTGNSSELEAKGAAIYTLGALGATDGCFFLPFPVVFPCTDNAIVRIANFSLLINPQGRRLSGSFDLTTLAGF